jgi:hypothetical protein
VSRVVATRYGFHVFYRRRPPSEAVVTGGHIIIGHDDARWLHRFVARGAVPARSRAQALALADELYTALRAAPERFDALVAERSEHRDAAWGGDIGTWSTRERTALPREVERLSQLEVGEVSAPMESLFGIELLVRRPSVIRLKLGMSALRLRYDPGAAAEDAASRASVERVGGGARAAARARPRPARELPGPRQPRADAVARRAAYAGLTRPVALLAVGQVAAAPIEWESSFYIPRRIDPATLPPPRPALLDFPASGAAPAGSGAAPHDSAAHR